MYALIDCNNFYASCERLFRPDLNKKPIIVLSNNDGCVVARSNEAKAIGIKMGEPYFKIRSLCDARHINVFSPNYPLYGDLSARVMSTIEAFWPHVEIYSIDEAFLDLTTLPREEHVSFCLSLQQRILKNIGIPVSVGIGQTKTLAKAANYICKKIMKKPVVDITNLREFWLKQLPVEEIWGVGRQWSKKLQALNLVTAYDLAHADVHALRRKFNVILQRTAFELQGIPCLLLEHEVSKQSIMSSRSFGSPQTTRDALFQAISAHVARAWEKMRKQNLKAQYISVFVRSNQFRTDQTQYVNSTGFQFTSPTDDIRLLTHTAKACLSKIFKEGIQYKKVGALLDGLVPSDGFQADLFHQPSDQQMQHTEALMRVIEKVNERFGRSALKLAAEGYSKSWIMKSDLKSPAYTTQWHELAIVRI